VDPKKLRVGGRGRTLGAAANLHFRMATGLWTVGHSTRSIEELIAVLQIHAIEAVADVRRFPGSRRLTQFGSAQLESSLIERGIDYRWLPSLGGRRKPLPNSINTAWKNESFRGYADHTATEEFADGFNELFGIAAGLRTTVMCAELLWWRCHRRIIADVATSVGVAVRHIRDAGPAEPHVISPPARLVNGVLSYAADDQLGIRFEPETPV
jgi:uncharacterized protein (DUF488 family)